VLTPQGEASRHTIRYPIFNGYATQDSTHNKQRGAVNHREGTHGGVWERSSTQGCRCRPEMESVDHQVTVFLVPFDKRIHGVTGVKQAAPPVTDKGSELTAAPAERVRELSGLLRLVKAERAKGLHMNEEDICGKYYRWKMDKAWSGKHTLRFYGALSSDEASILVQARAEYYGLNVCSFRKKLADSPACECGRGDETVLHVLLRCDR
jgi:hypothetical protein